MRTRTHASVAIEQLGMSVGTASNRLRKLVMFEMMQQLGRDSCFRCSLPITSPDEMTLDHKLPWRYVSAELFWDLDNLAFSHARCNIVERPGMNSRARKAPAGQSWCARCEKYLAVEQFQLDAGRVSGYKTYCRACRSADPELVRGKGS